MLELEEQIRRHGAWTRAHLPPLEGLPSSEPGVDDGGDLSYVAPIGRRSRSGAGRRPGRRVWLAVAAVTVLGVLGATLALAATRTASSRRDIPAADLAATSTASALIPDATVDGLTRWSASAHRPVEPNPATGLAPAATQLFGRDGQPVLLVSVQPMPSGTNALSYRSPGSIPQPVRGVPGQLEMADQQTTGISSDASESTRVDVDARSNLRWFERGAEITASFQHLTARQALDLVNGLEWASPTATDGFVVGTSSDLNVLVAAHTNSFTGSGVIAEYQYLTGPQARSAVHVITCPGGMGACPVLTDYAGAWFEGSRNPDGSATVWADGPWGVQGLSYEGLYVQVWPNDASVQVDFGPERTVDLDLAQRLATSVRLTDLDGLVGERSALTARMAGWPVEASAGLTGGRVEVRRNGTARAVCVTPTISSAMTCQIATPDSPIPLTTVSFLDHGRWLLAAMSAPTRTILVTQAEGDRTTIDVDEAVAGTGDQAQRLGLIVIPSDVGFFSVSASGSTHEETGPAVEVDRPAL